MLVLGRCAPGEPPALGVSFCSRRGAAVEGKVGEGAQLGRADGRRRGTTSACSAACAFPSSVASPRTLGCVRSAHPTLVLAANLSASRPTCAGLFARARSFPRAGVLSSATPLLGELAHRVRASALPLCATARIDKGFSQSTGVLVESVLCAFVARPAFMRAFWLPARDLHMLTPRFLRFQFVSSSSLSLSSSMVVLLQLYKSISLWFLHQVRCPSPFVLEVST